MFYVYHFWQTNDDKLQRWNYKQKASLNAKHFTWENYKHTDTGP